MARAIHDNLTLLKPARLTQDVTAFLIAKQAQGVSPRYLEFLRDELRFFGEFLADAGLDTVQSITAQAIRQYLIALGKRRNPGGVHCAFRAIKTFLRWYETEYQPEDWVNPIAKVKPPKLPQRPRRRSVRPRPHSPKERQPRGRPKRRQRAGRRRRRLSKLRRKPRRGRLSPSRPNANAPSRKR